MLDLNKTTGIIIKHLNYFIWKNVITSCKQLHVFTFQKESIIHVVPNFWNSFHVNFLYSLYYEIKISCIGIDGFKKHCISFFRFKNICTMLMTKDYEKTQHIWHKKWNICLSISLFLLFSVILLRCCHDYYYHKHNMHAADIVICSRSPSYIFINTIFKTISV